MLSFELTPEQEAFRQKVREFALKEVLPVAAYYDQKDETPMAVIRKAYDAGLINLGIPKKFGGQGLGLLEACLATEEMAAACAGMATTLFDNSLGIEPLLLSKNTALQDEYIPKIAKEFKMICFATSEPTMGSDVSAIRCHAAEDGDAYILNGT